MHYIKASLLACIAKIIFFHIIVGLKPLVYHHNTAGLALDSTIVLIFGFHSFQLSLLRFSTYSYRIKDDMECVSDSIQHDPL
jgi:hypothetical protein